MKIDDEDNPDGCIDTDHQYSEAQTCPKNSKGRSSFIEEPVEPFQDFDNRYEDDIPWEFPLVIAEPDIQVTLMTDMI